MASNTTLGKTTYPPIQYYNTWAKDKILHPAICQSNKSITQYDPHAPFTILIDIPLGETTVFQIVVWNAHMILQ